MRQPGILLACGLLCILAGTLGAKLYAAAGGQANISSDAIASDEMGAGISVVLAIVGFIVVSAVIAVALVQRRWDRKGKFASVRPDRLTWPLWRIQILAAMLIGIGSGQIILFDFNHKFSPQVLVIGVTIILAGTLAALEWVARVLVDEGGTGRVVRQAYHFLAGIMLVTGTVIATVILAGSLGGVASSAEVQGNLIALAGSLAVAYGVLGAWALIQAYRLRPSGNHVEKGVTKDNEY